MGRRSRKRSLTGEGAVRSGASGDRPDTGLSSRAERDAERRRRHAEAVAASQGGRSGRRGTGERPQAPWGAFPLAEIVVLLAIVLAVAGFLLRSERGTVMLIAGLVLGSLAGLELAAREHFAGYRSHTSLLAACAAFATGAVVAIALPGSITEVPKAIVAVAVIAVFGLAFWRLRTAFKRRSGGLSFR
ncbi:MAG: hypothetical protein AVDCRST_MAG45-1488 [uncultured Solirubrobacterales bacterium]|uniref:Uncharacterized protein n=1 Tax=uncultured Solirubrobacterales bacterium TaxID=768556 RepID=A0A6J4SSI4_9ACTN|nr:MAG: hypothetical protein AVDCRST_MAG45-1488 [uncultured Solirubrobacterales bacterium]